MLISMQNPVLHVSTMFKTECKALLKAHPRVSKHNLKSMATIFSFLFFVAMRQRFVCFLHSQISSRYPLQCCKHKPDTKSAVRHEGMCSAVSITSAPCVSSRSFSFHVLCTRTLQRKGRFFPTHPKIHTTFYSDSIVSCQHLRSATWVNHEPRTRHMLVFR